MKRVTRNKNSQQTHDKTQGGRSERKHNIWIQSKWTENRAERNRNERGEGILFIKYPERRSNERIRKSRGRFTKKDETQVVVLTKSRRRTGAKRYKHAPPPTDAPTTPTDIPMQIRGGLALKEHPHEQR